MIKNKKGFTLIEVIIAISIFTIIIGVGYNVLNKTNVSMAQQQVITDGQMNANLINKYLTKDLEQCIGLVEPIDTSGNQYQYELKRNESGTDKIIYKVTKNKKNTNMYYSVERSSLKSGEGTIQIITNQPTNSEEPFIINKNSLNSSLYEVALDYNENKRMKTYEFNVSSRILASSGNEGGNPDEEQLGDVGDIRFGYDKNKDEIWTSIDPKKNGAQNSEVKPGKFTEEYKFDVNIDRQSGKSYSQIMDGNNILKATSNANFFKDKEINNIKFGMQGSIGVKLEVRIKYKDKSKPLIINLDTYSGKIEESKTYPITSEIKDKSIIFKIPSYYDQKQESITIKGSVKKLNDSDTKGEVIIQLGKDLKI